MRAPPLLPNGARLQISQAEGVLGGVIWPAAATLCRHLVQQQQHPSTASPPNNRQPPWALELGSGTGCVGIYVAAALQRRVILTEHRPPLAAALSSVAYNVDGTLDYDLLEGSDVPKSDVLLTLLEKNVEQNRKLFQQDYCSEEDTLEDDNGTCTSNLALVKELDWTVPSHSEAILDTYSPNGFDLLFANDVTYITSLHAPLASTIARLLRKPNASSPRSSSVCIIAHQERVVNLLGEDFQLKSFLEALKQDGLQATIQEAPLEAGKDLNDEDLLMDKDEANLVNGPVKLLDIRHADGSVENDGPKLEVVEALMDVSCFRTPYHKRRNVELRTKFDRNGRVTELTLGPKVLSTFWELPESIGELKQLKKLALCHCSSLPTSLARLENLESLELLDCKGDDMMLSPLFQRDDFSDRTKQKFQSLESLEIKAGVWEGESMTQCAQWISQEGHMPKLELLRYLFLNSSLLHEIFDVLAGEQAKRKSFPLSNLKWLEFSFSEMTDEDFRQVLFRVVPLYPNLTTLSVAGNGIRSVQVLNDKSTKMAPLSQSLRTVKLDHNPILKYRSEESELNAIAPLLRNQLPSVGSLSTWENWEAPIEYLLRINRGGRILMEGASSENEGKRKIALSVWPAVLEVSYRTSSKGYIPERKNATALFYLLRHGPALSEVLAGKASTVARSEA